MHHEYKYVIHNSREMLQHQGLLYSISQKQAGSLVMG